MILGRCYQLNPKRKETAYLFKKLFDQRGINALEINFMLSSFRFLEDVS